MSLALWRKGLGPGKTQETDSNWKCLWCTSRESWWSWSERMKNRSGSWDRLLTFRGSPDKEGCSPLSRYRYCLRATSREELSFLWFTCKDDDEEGNE